MARAANILKTTVIISSKVAWYILRNTTYAFAVSIMMLISIGLWVNYMTQSTNRGTRKADRVLKAHNTKLALVWSLF